MPGFAAPALAPADAAVARRLLGEPCAGLAQVWAVPMSSFDFPDPEDVVVDFAAVTRPSVLRLPDGRRVFLAAAMPGDAHATNGFFAAYILGVEQRPLFPMRGGGTFGMPGTLSVPLQQPRGAYHVWLEGGGTWQDDTQGWAAITDFAGAIPVHRGRFLTRAQISCDHDPQVNAPCQGATEYAPTSITYADGANQLTLAWCLETYDVGAGGRKLNRSVRTLTARYALRDGIYQLVGGEEPPRI
jgi:hypothetical protein